MPMNAATRALIGRALHAREAAERVALAEARQAHARCEAEAQALRDLLARERDGGFAEAEPGGVAAAWRAATGARLDEARDAAWRAEAACESPRAALAATAQLQRGLAELRDREVAEQTRLAARRDPMQPLVALKAHLARGVV